MSEYERAMKDYDKRAKAAASDFENRRRSVLGELFGAIAGILFAVAGIMMLQIKSESAAQ